MESVESGNIRTIDGQKIVFIRNFARNVENCYKS